MKYCSFVVGDIMTNCYLLWSNKEAGVIDPGGPVDEVIGFIKKKGLVLKWIVNTHGHADHIAGNRILRKEFDVPILIHEPDQEMLTDPTANLSVFMGKGITSPEADKLLKEDDTLSLDAETLRVIDTPGHTPGGISLYTPGLLFAGDTLFFESIGRTDLPGGDQEQLLESVRKRLLTLPQETIVLPGHGEATTIGHESQSNPFLAI